VNSDALYSLDWNYADLGAQRGENGSEDPGWHRAVSWQPFDRI